MPTKDDIRDVLDRTRSYFVNSLLPFWMNKSPDPECGGFLSYFGRDGRPTGETTKPFLMQIRMLFAMSASHHPFFVNRTRFRHIMLHIHRHLTCRGEE
jgi:mannose/cellobiose epimerase-like protein (N-acyl-D-glucosamine 2-epimerase family)